MKVKIINMLRRIFFASYYMVNLIYIPMLYNKAYRRGTLSYLPAEDFEIWKKSMLKMLKEFCQAGNNFKIRQVINSFAKSKIHVIRKCEIYTNEIGKMTLADNRLNMSFYHETPLTVESPQVLVCGEFRCLLITTECWVLRDLRLWIMAPMMGLMNGS